MAGKSTKAPGRPFPKGESGNPAGRSRRPEVAARAHAPAAVEALAAVMSDPAVEPAVRVKAAAAILDCSAATRVRAEAR